MRMPCPRCDGPVFARRLAGVPIDVCRRCRGIWLDRGKLERLRVRRSGHAHDWNPNEPEGLIWGRRLLRYLRRRLGRLGIDS